MLCQAASQLPCSSATPLIWVQPTMSTCFIALQTLNLRTLLACCTMQTRLSAGTMAFARKHIPRS